MHVRNAMFAMRKPIRSHKSHWRQRIAWFSPPPSSKHQTYTVRSGKNIAHLTVFVYFRAAGGEECKFPFAPSPSPASSLFQILYYSEDSPSPSSPLPLFLSKARGRALIPERPEEWKEEGEGRGGGGPSLLIPHFLSEPNQTCQFSHHCWSASKLHNIILQCIVIGIWLGLFINVFFCRLRCLPLWDFGLWEHTWKRASIQVRQTLPDDSTVRNTSRIGTPILRNSAPIFLLSHEKELKDLKKKNLCLRSLFLFSECVKPPFSRISTGTVAGGERGGGEVT